MYSGWFYLIVLLCMLKLASLYSICKEVNRTAIAWFTLVRPVEPLDAMEAHVVLLLVGSLGMPRLTVGINFCSEFADVF